jgi:hypothetical protein
VRGPGREPLESRFVIYRRQRCGQSAFTATVHPFLRGPRTPPRFLRGVAHRIGRIHVHLIAGVDCREIEPLTVGRLNHPASKRSLQGQRRTRSKTTTRSSRSSGPFLRLRPTHRVPATTRTASTRSPTITTWVETNHFDFSLESGHGALPHAAAMSQRPSSTTTNQGVSLATTSAITMDLSRLASPFAGPSIVLVQSPARPGDRSWSRLTTPHEVEVLAIQAAMLREPRRRSPEQGPGGRTRHAVPPGQTDRVPRERLGFR